MAGICYLTRWLIGGIETAFYLLLSITIMGTITASKGTTKPREKVTEWWHEALLIRIIDLGTQKPSPKAMYQDPSRQIELVYEVLDQTIKINWEDKPMRVYEKVSPYISEKKVTNYHKKLNQLISGAG